MMGILEYQSFNFYIILKLFYRLMSTRLNENTLILQVGF